MRQQNLQRQQRSLQFTMNEPHRAAGEFDFLERPLIGSEKAFVTPSPAIVFGRRFRREPLRRKDVGQEPNVVLGLPFGRHTNQPTQKRLLLLLLDCFRPVVDQAFLPLLDGRFIQGLLANLRRHPQQTRLAVLENRAGQFIAHRGRIGHDQGIHRQQGQHLSQVQPFVGGSLADPPAPQQPRSEVDEGITQAVGADASLLPLPMWASSSAERGHSIRDPSQPIGTKPSIVSRSA